MPKDRPDASVSMPYQWTALRICLVLLLMTINDVVNLEITSQCDSRVSAGNEDHWTGIDRLPVAKKLAMEQEILRQLGLPVKAKRTNGTATLMKQSARKFLIDMYKHIANEDTEEKPQESLEPSEFDVTESDLGAMDQSNVAITFTAQQSHQGIKELLWFNVDTVPPEYQMTSAKLRLYRALDAENLENRGAFNVTVYRVLRPEDGESETEFVDSASTAAEHQGWITLDVTEALRHWMKHPDDNKGLYVSVRPIDRPSNETRTEDIGIVSFDGDDERQPFMAGFFRTNEYRKNGRIEPNLRSFKDNKRNKKRHTSNKTPGNACKVEKLYVSLKDLLWDGWIVYPAGFYANYCSGECNFPLTAHMHATNHAIIQTIANMLYPEKIPKVCCVPTELWGINVLYFIDGNTTALKKWGIPNMSVQGCGCR